MLFSATFRLLQALVPHVEHKRTVGLDERLMMDLLDAAMKCPTFNERQKYALNIAAKNYQAINQIAASSRFWPFDTLARKPYATEAHIQVCLDPYLYACIHTLFSCVR